MSSTWDLQSGRSSSSIQWVDIYHEISIHFKSDFLMLFNVNARINDVEIRAFFLNSSTRDTIHPGMFYRPISSL